MPYLNHEYTVHKFGGTSVANTERFIELKLLLTGKNEVIVVSATQPCDLMPPKYNPCPQIS